MENVKVREEIEVVIQEANDILNDSQGLTIKDNDDFAKATVILRKVKSKTKELDAERKNMTKPIDESKKRIMDFFRAPLDVLKSAEDAIKKGILIFQNEQERIRKEEQDRLDREARERERKERERLELRAAKEREKQREIYLKIKEEQDEKAKIKLQNKLEKSQEKEDNFLSDAEDVQEIVPTVQVQVEKQNGVSTRKVWKYKIVDVNLIPREYMIPNEKLLAKIATMRGSVTIAGIEIYYEETIASRR